MFEEITQNMNDYMDKLDTASHVRDEGIGKCKEMYKGDALEQKMGEAEQIYRGIVDEATTQSLTSVNQSIQEAEDLIIKHMQEPVPADFTATLEAVKNRQHITPSEARILFDKYKSNYVASTTLAEILNSKMPKDEAHDYTIKTVDYSTIENELNKMKSSVKRFYSSSVTGLEKALISSGTGPSLSNRVKRFLETSEI